MGAPGDLGAGPVGGLAAGLSQTTVATPGTALTTATPANVASKSLSPGTYLVWGIVDFGLTTVTGTEFRSGVSVTTATLQGQAGGSGMGPDPTSVYPVAPAITTDTLNDIAGPTVLTITVTTTIYLVAQATFSAGTVTAYGTLNALLL
jgi:hypothetical protein